MRVRGFGVFLIAVLLTAGPVGAQQTEASAGSESAAAVDWLSPEPLAWTNPDTFSWATSPIKLIYREFGSYNSNILGSAPNSILAPGETRGDYVLNTTIGASTKAQVGAQQFFADASYNVINYRKNIGFDGHNYNADVGINWELPSRCVGTVFASSSQKQAGQEELFGPGIETTRSQMIFETSKCGIYQKFSGIVNSGATNTSNVIQGGQRGSNIGASALDNITAYVQGGIEYEWTGLNNIQFLTKFSETHFTNSFLAQAASDYNASSLLDSHNLNFSVVYNRTFSEMLNISASGGVALISNQFIGGLSSSPASTPTYSLRVNWLPTPKWAFQLNVARTVAPPTSILSGTQVGEIEAVSVSYIWTPKLSLSAAISHSNTSGAQQISNLVTQALGGFGASSLNSGTMAANYQVTPFTTATLSFQYTTRNTPVVNATGNTTAENISTGIILLGLDYQPR